MNKKYIFLAALIIALVIAYFTWDDVNAVDIKASALAAEYSDNPEAANEKYLNRNLRVEGTVKAFYKILGARPVLELETGDNPVPLFFFFLSEENEFYAGQLQLGQHVVIKGKCVGKEAYSFVDGIKIEVEKFVE